MVRLVVATILLASLFSCRIFRASEWKRRDRCAEQIRVYRGEPDRPYEAVRVFEKPTEHDIRWEACAMRADAVIMLGASGSMEAHTATGPGWSRTRFSDSGDFRGVAIRYRDGGGR